MQAASLKDIKKELEQLPPQELLALCLRLGRFKKENKELLSYLLLQSTDEAAFIQTEQAEMDAAFADIKDKTYFLMKKGVRKILRNVKTSIRYSGKKETEVELLLHFCTLLKQMNLAVRRNTEIKNLYDRQIDLIRKRIAGLHEDLQYDFTLVLEELL